ncbi:hypothetical protein H0A70_07915 [Alcaligenaceae bacterium]|nr:hypothetical protein [Alcaligenaceae bacterium]
MGLTVYQSHEDDFAKIIRTESGRQILVFCGSDEEGNPEAVQMTCIDGVTVRIGASFNDDDAGYDKRDHFFESIDAAKAAAFEAMALGVAIGAGGNE